MHARDDVNPHISRMLEGKFSLDAAQVRSDKFAHILGQVK